MEKIRDTDGIKAWYQNDVTFIFNENGNWYVIYGDSLNLRITPTDIEFLAGDISDLRSVLESLTGEDEP